MEARETQQQLQQRGVNQLLHFAELLEQALEVKLEVMFFYPTFLRQLLSHGNQRRTVLDVVRSGEAIVHHVSMLQGILRDLGCESSAAVASSHGMSDEAVAGAILFHEKLAYQILQECGRILDGTWDSSQLRQWLKERLETVHHETQQSVAFLKKHLEKSGDGRFSDTLTQHFQVAAAS